MPLLLQTEQREHSAGLPFLSPVGIILIEIAGGADTTVVDLPNASNTALLDDVSCKIDLVMRRTNARTELDDQAGGIRSKARRHLLDC